MPKNRTLESTNAFAKEYDDHIQTKTWFAPDVIFGLLFPYINPGEVLLDIGIGTGLSALPFHKAGMEIFGVDGSEEMIRICRSKHFVKELKMVDLCRFDPPLFDRQFDAVVAVGIFHFFDDLAPLFREIGNRIKTGGIFGFTTFRFEPDEDNGFRPSGIKGVLEKTRSHYDIRMFQHDPAIIRNLLKKNGFTLLKKIEFLAFQDPDEFSEYYLSGYTALKE